MRPYITSHGSPVGAQATFGGGAANAALDIVKEVLTEHEHHPEALKCARFYDSSSPL